MDNIAKLKNNIVMAAGDYRYWFSEFRRLNCAWVGKPIAEQAKLQAEFNQVVEDMKASQEHLFNFIDQLEALEAKQ